MKSHYYSQHAVALRAELGAGACRATRCASSTGSRLAALRGRGAAVRDPGAGHMGADPFRQPADLGSAGVRPGLHGLQLHGAAARGRAPHDLRAAPAGGRAGPRACSTRCPSGISASQFTRWHLDHHAELGSDEDDPKRAPPVAEGQRALVQAAVLHAGAVPDLFPRGAPRVVDLSGGAAAARSAASARCRSRRT